ncbi:hypothetical protein [Mycolicibacterium sp. P9-64]|uniref:hypothetical protein n=1 Tax=Mycolicibacterium sp. P9-64 TaxID=2024612 RepID=UPI0011ED3AA8|nr:hypothetical protein [Mycolicibacterium sp. P9-64]
MTAVQLAERTRDLGYPITRVTITKIETNNRAGKFGIAEWLVLAAALKVPPSLLLFSDFPDGGATIVLPAFDVDSRRAYLWLAGVETLPAESSGASAETMEPNAGTRLVQAVADRTMLDRNVSELRAMACEQGQPAHVVEQTQRLLHEKQEAALRVMGDLARAKADLWRNPKDEANAVLWDQREDEIDG